MSLDVSIGGSPVTIDEGTLQIAAVINGIDRLSVEVTSVDGSVRPALGAAVLVSKSVAVLTSSVASPTVLTTTEPHGIVSGQTVTIAGHTGSTPALSGAYVATRTGPTTFTVPVNVTTGGTGGTVARRIFGGSVCKPTERGFQGVGLTPITTAVNALDFNALADRRYVTATIPAGTLLAALQVLVTYLTPYGVTLDSAQATGPTLPALTYDAKKLSEVFTDLETLSGYVRDISYEQVLGMYAPGTIAAPFNITDGDGYVDGDLEVEPGDEGYANRVILRAGTAVQVEETDTWTANGTARSWDFTYPVVQRWYAVYVTPPGGSATLYIIPEDGVGTTLTIAFAAGTISQNVGQTTYVSGTTITILYMAQFPFTVQAPLASTEPTAEQIAHGLWEIAVAAPDCTNATTAQAMAEAELDVRVSATARIVRYATYADGLRPGQIQTINSTTRHISVSCLITEVRARDVRNLMRYDVTAVEGTTSQGSWRDTYQQWSGGGTSTMAAISGGGSPPSSSSSMPTVAYLGGSRLNGIAGDAGTVDAPNHVSVPVRWGEIGSVTVTVSVQVKTSNAAVSVTPSVYDDTASAVAATGSASTSTTWVTQMLTLTRPSAGLTHTYRLQLTGSGGSDDVFVCSHPGVQIVPA